MKMFTSGADAAIVIAITSTSPSLGRVRSPFALCLIATVAVLQLQ